MIPTFYHYFRSRIWVQWSSRNFYTRNFVSFNHY